MYQCHEVLVSKVNCLYLKTILHMQPTIASIEGDGIFIVQNVAKL